MVDRFIGSNKVRQGGVPVLHRQDFEAHKTGGDFRHTADQIDMNPPVGSLGEPTVQGSLELISNIISSGGSGYISIGSTAGASGIYNVGSIDTPTLKDAIEAAMADDRIVNYGGTILILAGVYSTSSTIEIEPGIRIIGENAGTIINSQTSNQPIFKIKRTVDSNNINGNSGSGDIAISTGSNLEKVIFEHLILVDNLNGSVNSGNCTLATSSMIQVERGANFECQYVSFWGRLNDGSVVSRQKTRHAIATTTGSANGTTITVNRCFFDGLCNPINFNTQLGNIDFLNVTNSKFRYYGLETPAPSTTLNTVITTSYCNLNITNNYAVAGSADARIFLTITDTGGSISNIHSLISNNLGYVQNSTTEFIKNNLTNSTTVINLKLSNNLWYSNAALCNKFTIKIANNTTANAEDVDLYGSHSLGSLIQSDLEAEVVLYPGTYNVNLSNSFETRLSLVGIRSQSDLPIINFDISAGSTDNLNNRFVTFINTLKNVRMFTAPNKAKISAYLSWGFGINSDVINNNKEAIVENCVFDDVTLGSQNSMTVEDDGRYYLSFIVKNSTFSTSTANLGGAGNVCLRLAPTNLSLIDNCLFKPLSGYAISYGSALYTSPGSTNSFINKLVIKNTTIDLFKSNYWFTEPGAFSLAKGSARSYLIDIDDGGSSASQNTDLLIDNLTVRVDSNTSQEASNSFYTGLDVRRFININVDYCTIKNSKFEIPYHTYTNSGTKAITGLYITWRKNVNISDCHFFGGSNALKVILPTGATYYPNNLYISNNIFEPTLSGDLATRTLLDIDVAYQASPNNNGKIKVNNNSFFIKKDNELFSIDTQYTYKTYGAIQINAPGYDVDFESNSVRTTLREISGATNENLAGVYINTSKNNNVLINRFTNLNVNNNNINLENIFNIGGAQPDSSSNIFAALWCETTIAKITNNFLNYQSQTTVGTGVKTDLCLECSNVGSAGDYIISNNIFSRADRAGVMGNYIDNYIYLTNTNVYGRIIDNSFVNEDPSGNEGYDDLLIIGPSVTIEPIYERNKNQRKIVIYSGYGFQASLNDSILNNAPLESHQINTTVSSGLADSSDPQWQFVYNGEQFMTYRLFAPLEQLIPVGSYLRSASASVSVGSTLNTSAVTLKVYNMSDDISVTSNSVNLASVTSGTASLSAAARQFISGEHKTVLLLTITADLSSPGTRTITVSNITLEYQY